MEFVTGILKGTSVPLIAEKYAKFFIDAALTDPFNWHAKVSHNFNKQCFLVASVYWKYPILPYLSAEQQIVLPAIDVFFEELPRHLAEYYDIWIQLKSDSELENQFDKLSQPLPCYFRLIYTWCTVASSMCEETAKKPGNCSQNLARVAFSILHGLVGLLNKYGVAHPELKDLCLMLTQVVHFGVSCPQTNLVIVTPMLQIFEQHYKIFFGENLEALVFVHSVLICKTPLDNNIKVYEFLKTMLTQLGQSQEVDEKGQLYLVHHLTKKLVEDNFIDIQFDEFSKSDSTPLLKAGLKYLLTLQEHILSTDCFSRRFLESILHIILRLNTTSVSSLAAKLYVKLARRQFDDMEIMMHMLEAFYKLHHLKRGSVIYKNFTDSLKMYIEALLSNCEDLISFENFLYILNNKFVRHELALLSAQAFIVLFKMHQDCALTNCRSKQQVTYILEHLPQCITQAQSVEIRIALYSVYDAVNLNVLKEEKEILTSLDEFFWHNFLLDCSLTDSEYRTIFHNIGRLADVTGNAKTLETVGTLVLEDFESIWQSISQKQIVPCKSERLFNCLRRLNAVFRTFQEPVSNLRSVYNNLLSLFSGEYTVSHSLAGYGFETLAYMCVNLAEDKAQSEEELNELSKVVQELSIACRNQLHATLTTDRDQQYNKFISCAIMVLTLRFGEVVALDKETYDVLTDAYLMAIDNLQRGGDDLAYDCFKEISAIFLALNKKNFDLLPSYRIWEIVAVYGSTGSCSDDIMPELEKLILLLLESRIEAYAFCLPIIYMHINHNSSTKASINSFIADHITLIDKHASEIDAWHLKSNTLISTLQFIEEFESFTKKHVNSSGGNNRLIALSYLDPLFVRLRFDENYFKYLDGFIDKIGKKALNASERQELEDFISKISEHKKLCLSESKVVHAFVNNEWIKLKDRPVGGAPAWYLANSNKN